MERIVVQPDGSQPLALFDAQRVDYALARLRHYTATDPTFFQNHVLFTNYQFYVEEFEAFAREQMVDPKQRLSGLCWPGQSLHHSCRCLSASTAKNATNADLPPDASRWQWHHIGEYRRWPVECQNCH